MKAGFVKKLAIEKIKTDVLVIGGGAAGLTAALEAREKGGNVTIISKSRVGRSGNTVIAGTGMAILAPDPDSKDTPEIFRDDPYQKGWICKIRPLDWRKEINACLLAEDATSWAVNEMGRLKDFLIRGSLKQDQPEPAVEILQDGGEVREKILSELPDKAWKDFQEEFMSLS